MNRRRASSDYKTKPFHHKPKLVGHFAKNADERNELLLNKMMNIAAVRCPEDQFIRMCIKLKVPNDAIENVIDAQSTQQEILIELFSVWRNSQPIKSLPVELIQTKFMHIVDLVDLPKILSKLEAIQIYAKAPKF